MKAVHYLGPQNLAIVDVPIPEISENEVLLKIKMVGICGTDLHIYNGKVDIKAPQIIGHEFVGVIEKVGSAVVNFKQGEKVVAEHVIGCGECEQCLEGRKNICINPTVLGLHKAGALAEYMALDQTLIYKIPEDMPFEDAVLAEPLSVAVYAVNRSAIKQGNVCAVIGQGPIGIFLDAVLKAKGIEVNGIDILDYRLNFVKEKGFVKNAINSKELSFEQIKDQFIKNGADYVFEAVGVEPTTQLAIDLVKRGGEIMILGVYEHNISINLMKIVRGEITVRGSWTCLNSFQETIDLIHSKKIDVSSFVTHKYKLEEVSKAFEDANNYSDNRIKSVIVFD